MQDGLFFRVLRRFNILWIAIAGLVIIAASGYHLYKYFGVRHHMPMVGFLSEPRVALASSSPSEPWIVPDDYGSAETQYGPWDGKLFVLMRNNPIPDLQTPDAFEGYVPSVVMNVLVVDPKSGEGAWLFPTNKQIINIREALFEGAAKVQSQPATDQRPAMGMVMYVTDTDTNKDGKLTAKDATSVYFWLKGATSATKLFSADRILNYNQAGADRYVILYQKGKETHSAVYSLPDFKQLSDKRMPDAPH
jgi:hypothetical protein